MDILSLQSVMELVAAVLLHSLWQGALIGLLYALSMLYFKDSSPRARYGCAVFWLVAMALSPIVTGLVLLGSPPTWLTLPGSAALILPDIAQQEMSWFGQLAPVWASLWLAGVALLSLRLAWNWQRAQRLTHAGCHSMGPVWEQRLGVLARQIGVSLPVRLVESAVVQVPTVIGWLKPVILIPSSAMLGLSRRQLELVIAHELAHIARYDYGVNYILVLVETLWFYHPAVYLIGHGIREERELCCDDLVVSRCGSRYEYITALTDLETMRSSHFLNEPLSNMAATGGNLLFRVQRIVKGAAPRASSLYMTTIALALTLLLGGVMLYTPSPASPVALLPQIAPPPAPTLRVLPIETVVRAPALRTVSAMLDASRSVALFAEPPALAPEIEGAAGDIQSNGYWHYMVGRGPRRDDGATVSSVELPTISLANVKVVSDHSVPERAGPTSAMMNELHLASPALASLADLRRDASRALAEASASFDSADIERPSDFVVTDVGRVAFNEQGGALIKRIEPRYPSRARMHGYTGTVQIEFLVSDRGEVSNIVVLNEGAYMSFERAVVRAVREWRYEPLLRNGVPVERRMVETFDFRLRGPDTPSSGPGCKRDKNNRYTCTTPGVNRVL
jgi:TonB family protein